MTHFREHRCPRCGVAGLYLYTGWAADLPLTKQGRLDLPRRRDRGVEETLLNTFACLILQCIRYEDGCTFIVAGFEDSAGGIVLPPNPAIDIDQFVVRDNLIPLPRLAAEIERYQKGIEP